MFCTWNGKSFLLGTNHYYVVRLEVFTAVKIEIDFLWVVTLYNITEATRSSETLVPHHNNTRSHDSHDLDLKHYCFFLGGGFLRCDAFGWGPMLNLNFYVVLYIHSTHQELTSHQNMLWHFPCNLKFYDVSDWAKWTNVMKISRCTFKYVLVRINVFRRFGRASHNKCSQQELGIQEAISLILM